MHVESLFQEVLEPFFRCTLGAKWQETNGLSASNKLLILNHLSQFDNASLDERRLWEKRSRAPQNFMSSGAMKFVTMADVDAREQEYVIWEPEKTW